MEHRIGYTHRKDGVSIAYATAGSGPSIVYSPGWVSHLEWSFQPPYDAFWELVAPRRRLVTYDKHGTGLSDRDRDDFSLDAEVGDLETVVDHLGLQQFDLMAASEGGPTGITYAARHPERVRRLVLWATYASGPSLAPADFRESFVGMVRASWGMGSKMLTDMLLPGATAEEAQSFARMQRATATPQVAAGILESLYSWDVSDLLPKITAPTLVIQRKGDRAFSVRHAKMLAAGIPNARLTLLEGNEHVPSRGDTAAAFEEILAFLDEGVAPSTPPLDAPDGNSVRTILFTDLEEHTAIISRLGDAKGRDLLREHEHRTREALRANGGTEVKSMGDGFMASFGSAQKALECALAIQQAFAEPVLGEALRVRIGVNAGEPVAEDDDLFGASVIAAARIAAKANGGQVFVADVVRQLVAGKGFLFSDTGQHDLKGFEEPVRLWELRLG